MCKYFLRCFSTLGLGLLRWRLIFAILGCIGIAIIYGLKVNLHANIVAMVNNTGLKMVKERRAEENLKDKRYRLSTYDDQFMSEVDYTMCYEQSKLDSNKTMDGTDSQGSKVL